MLWLDSALISGVITGTRTPQIVFLSGDFLRMTSSQLAFSSPVISAIFTSFKPNQQRMFQLMTPTDIISFVSVTFRWLFCLRVMSKAETNVSILKDQCMLVIKADFAVCLHYIDVKNDIVYFASAWVAVYWSPGNFLLFQTKCVYYRTYSWRILMVKFTYRTTVQLSS